MGMDTCEQCKKQSPDLYSTCMHCGARLHPVWWDLFQLAFMLVFMTLVLGLWLWLWGLFFEWLEGQSWAT